MTQSPDRPPAHEARPAESEHAAGSWQTPTLTLLGNVDDLTLGIGGSLFDGPFNTPGL